MKKNMSGTFNNATIKTIQSMYQQYFSISEIGRKLGLNRKVVAFELRELGYSIHNDSGYNNSAKDKYSLAKDEYLNGEEGIAFLSRKYCFDPCRFSLYLYDQGINVKSGSIAKKLKLYENTLKKALKLYLDEGMGVRTISKALKIPRHYVHYYLVKNGQDPIEGAKTYKVDESVFEKLDNEEKVYWFGYLMADGNVCDRGRHVLELASKDKEQLEKFTKFLKTDAPVADKDVLLNDKVFPNYRVSISSKKIVTDLIKLGLLPNKSLILKFPKQNVVPKELSRHLIRGYFDGDGHLSPFKRYEMNKEQCFVIFVGTRKFLQELPGFFNVELNKLTSKGQAFSLRYGGNRKAFGIAHYLYKDAQIYLDRKYVEYIKWRNYLL